MWLSPKCLMRHYLVVNNAFGPFDTNLNGFVHCFNYSSCSCSVLVMSFHMDSFDSKKLSIVGLIQICGCALNWFIVELFHGCVLDICHLHDLALIENMVKNTVVIFPLRFFWPLFWCVLHQTSNQVAWYRDKIPSTCILVDPYVQMIPNWPEYLHETQTYNILNIFCWILKLHMCWWCKSMWKVHNCGTATSNYKASQKSKNNGFKIWESIWIGVLPLSLMRVIFVTWWWFKWRFDFYFLTTNLISKVLFPKTLLTILE